VEKMLFPITILFSFSRYDAEKDPIAFDVEKDAFGREIGSALNDLDVLKSTSNQDER
jgi:hypothetical protein